MFTFIDRASSIEVQYLVVVIDCIPNDVYHILYRIPYMVKNLIENSIVTLSIHRWFVAGFDLIFFFFFFFVCTSCSYLIDRSFHGAVTPTNKRWKWKEERDGREGKREREKMTQFYSVHINFIYFKLNFCNLRCTTHESPL